MRFVKPLDEELLKELTLSHRGFVTIEDGVIAGGAGSAVQEFFNRQNIQVNLLQMGLPDQFIDHGDVAKLMSQLGLDHQGIEKSIQDRFFS